MQYDVITHFTVTTTACDINNQRLVWFIIVYRHIKQKQAISCHRGRKYITMKQYNKPRNHKTLFGLGFVEIIHSAWLGFLRGVFLANHLASIDNLTRTTKRQNTYK